MDNNDRLFPMIIENSPVEFAILGPSTRHRGVLVKSNRASFDLIGYDNPYSDTFHDDNKFADVVGAIFGSVTRSIFNKTKVNVVRAQTASINELSERKSYVSFVWYGMCEIKDFKQFQESFYKSSADLNMAISAGDKSEVEYIVSGLALTCSVMDRRARQAKHFAAAAICIIYLAVIILSITLYGAVRHFDMPIVVR